MFHTQHAQTPAAHDTTKAARGHESKEEVCMYVECQRVIPIFGGNQLGVRGLRPPPRRSWA